jgi:hypothetical protein
LIILIWVTSSGTIFLINLLGALLNSRITSPLCVRSCGICYGTE